MPTLQQFGLCWEAAITALNVARDMAKNAKQDLAAADVAAQSAVAVANANGYLRLLNDVRNNADPDVQTAINQAVTALGISDAATRADQLIALATTYRDASRTTKAELDAAANAILTAIPKAISVF